MSVIVKDVQGVIGLHLITNAFNEEFEMELYRNQNLFPGSEYDYEEWEMKKGKKARTGPPPATLNKWPQGNPQLIC